MKAAASWITLSHAAANTMLTQHHKAWFQYDTHAGEGTPGDVPCASSPGSPEEQQEVQTPVCHSTWVAINTVL